MNKRAIIVIHFLIVMLILTGCGAEKVTNSIESKKSLVVENKVMLADSQVELFVKSADYQLADLAERKNIVNTVLQQLKEKKLIESYSYNDDEWVYLYEHIDGSSGEVRLAD